MAEESSESDEIFHFKITGNIYELSTRGSLSTLRDKVDEIIDFIVLLNEKLQAAELIQETVPTEEIPTEEEIERAPVVEVPVIKPTRSTQDNILSLFKQQWGTTPRSAAEVSRALEVNAVPDSPPAVSVYLRRLVQKGELRRIQRDRLWHYYKIPERVEE